MVLELIVVPERDQRRHHTDQYPLDATHVWDPVQHSVAFSGDHKLVEIHFKRDVHYCSRVFFVGLSLFLLEFEQSGIGQLSDLVQV